MMTRGEIRAIAYGLSTPRLSEIRKSHENLKSSKSQMIREEVSDALIKRYIYWTKDLNKEVHLRIPIKDNDQYIFDDLKKIIEVHKDYDKMIVVMNHSDLVRVFRLGFRCMDIKDGYSPVIAIKKYSFGETVQRLHEDGWVSLWKLRD